MTPIAPAKGRRPHAQAWFFGVAAAAAASTGLAAVQAAPPLFLVMTTLVLACEYGLVTLREARHAIATTSLLLTVGWLLLAAWPLYADYSWNSHPFIIALLAGCACLRALRWRAAGAAVPTLAIAAAGFAALAWLALASHPRAFGAAAAVQVELLATGADWLVIAWLAPAPLRRRRALRWMDAPLREPTAAIEAA